MNSIPEKTLEMNLSENLVNRIRKYISPKAFIYGFSMREEPNHGLDSSINLPYSAFFLFALQYKRPDRKTNGEYYFKIDGTQHLKLLISSFLFENIWYALPLISDKNEISHYSPEFIDRTIFIKPKDFPYSTFDENPHKIKIDEKNRSIFVSSEQPKEIKKFIWGNDFNSSLKLIEKISIDSIKAQKLGFNELANKLRENGINEEIIDRLRDEKKRRYKRFSSGFFIGNNHEQ